MKEIGASSLVAEQDKRSSVTKENVEDGTIEHEDLEECRNSPRLSYRTNDQALYPRKVPWPKLFGYSIHVVAMWKLGAKAPK
jgi:hypothetical protein